MTIFRRAKHRQEIPSGEAIADLFIDKGLNLLTHGLEEVSYSIYRDSKMNREDGRSILYFKILKEVEEEVRIQREHREDERWIGLEDQRKTMLPKWVHDKVHDYIVDAIKAKVREALSETALAAFGVEAGSAVVRGGSKSGLLTFMMAMGWSTYQTIDDTNKATTIAKQVLAMLENHWDEEQRHNDKLQAEAVKAMNDFIEALPTDLGGHYRQYLESGQLRTISNGNGKVHVLDPIVSVVQPEGTYHRTKHDASVPETKENAEVMKHLAHHMFEDSDPLIESLKTQLETGRSGLSSVSMRTVDWRLVMASFGAASAAYEDTDGYNHMEQYFLPVYSSTVFHELKTSVGNSVSVRVSNSSRGQVLFISSKGTTTAKEWMNNLRMGQDMYPQFVSTREDVRVHIGFSYMLDLVTELLIPILRKVPRLRRDALVVFSGHSLGGALSILLAGHREVRSEISRMFSGRHGGLFPCRVYTFGSPRVGNDSFCKELESIHRLGIQRFSNTDDPVPFLPTAGQGYSHTGIEFRIAETGVFSVIHGGGVTEHQREMSSGERSFMITTFETKDHGHSRNKYDERLTEMRTLQEGLPLTVGGNLRQNIIRGIFSSNDQYKKTITMSDLLSEAAGVAGAEMKKRAKAKGVSVIDDFVKSKDHDATVTRYIGNLMGTRAAREFHRLVGSKQMVSKMMSELVHKILT